MKLRRSYFVALAVSFVVMIAAGVLASIILTSIPTTAWSQQLRYIDINHGSPAVYPSQAFRERSPQLSGEDEWATVPVMLIAGLALGLTLARATLRETVGYAIGTGVLLSVLILAMDAFATYAEQQIARQAGTIYGVIFDSRYFIEAAGAVVLRTALYAAGAICGHLIRRRFTRSDGSRAPKAAGSKPAPTS